jgi:hypothetical protein
VSLGIIPVELARRLYDAANQHGVWVVLQLPEVLAARAESPTVE